MGKINRNHLKSYREKVFISKAELARNAGISPVTIDRIEGGKICRLETKGKSSWRLDWSCLRPAKYSWKQSEYFALYLR